MSSIFGTCHCIFLRAGALTLSLLVSSSVLFAEDFQSKPASHEATAFSEQVQTLIPTESQTAPKRDLQAAVASLRQSPQPEPEISPWPLAKGLALCLAVFCVIIYLLKRLNPHSVHSGKRRLAVLERLPLSPKSSLVLIQVDGRTRVIAVGSEQVQMLDGWEKLRSPAREFGEVLAAVPGSPTEFSEAVHGKGAV